MTFREVGQSVRKLSTRLIAADSESKPRLLHWLLFHLVSDLIFFTLYDDTDLLSFELQIYALPRSFPKRAGDAPGGSGVTGAH